MTFYVKVMLGLGAFFAGPAAAVLLPRSERDMWAPVIVGSVVFAYIGFAFGTVRWAVVSVPMFVVSVIGFNYFRLHATEPSGIAVVIATIVGNSILSWVRFRKKPADSHP